MKTLMDKEFTKRTGVVFMAGFLAAFVLLGLLGADLVQDTPGPFQISAAEGPVVYIVDTRTGHTWMRSGAVWRDLGTPEEPEYESEHLSR